MRKRNLQIDDNYKCRFVVPYYMGTLNIYSIKYVDEWGIDCTCSHEDT